jgi:putative ABC transport system ATP-binding protein
MKKIVEIKELERFFMEGKEPFMVLKKLSLDVMRGECIILQGVSGSGKTTLLHLIAGLDKPDSGMILVDNMPINKLSDHYLSSFRGHHVGMVFQNFYLIEHLSVFDNIAVPLIVTQMDYASQQEEVEKAMKLANISHKASSLAVDLSGGEKQRVAIARALVSDPNIILCDEPTANLDKDNTESFIEVIKKLHYMGKTLIIATHNPRFDDLPFPSRIIRMEQGEIIL